MVIAITPVRIRTLVKRMYHNGMSFLFCNMAAGGETAIWPRKTL